MCCFCSSNVARASSSGRGEEAASVCCGTGASTSAEPFIVFCCVGLGSGCISPRGLVRSTR